MAFLGLKIASDVSRLFGEIDVPGEKTDTSTLHVTLIYLGKKVSIDTLTDAVKAIYKVTSHTKPFALRTSRVSSFPPCPDGVAVIARVDSDPLHDLRAEIAEALDEAGVPFDKTYPEFRPHVTLSWAPGDTVVDEIRIPTTLEWGAAELVLWGGDNGDRKLTVTFPFSLKSEAAE